MYYRDALRKGLFLGHVRVAVHVHRANANGHRAFNVCADGIADMDRLAGLRARMGKGGQMAWSAANGPSSM